MRIKKHGGCFALSLLTMAVNQAVYAAEEPQMMGEVVVTATKSAKDTLDAPATVSVVRAKDIEGMNIQSADEALKFTPGAYATSTGGHQPSVMSTTVVLRGIPDYSRTLVLVDGQKLNDPYIGAVTWESVPPETIERIEVVPGPFSSIYGGSAMGGVINIITKKPTTTRALVKAGYGTYGTRIGSVLIEGKPTERLGISFNYSYKDSNGYIMNDVVVAPSGAAGTVVSGGVRTTDVYGNTRYLIGDKGPVPWKSDNTELKLFADLPHDSKLVFDYTRFSYTKEWDRFNTYLRNNAGAPVTSSQVTFGTSGQNAKVTEAMFLNGPNPKIQNRYATDLTTKLANDSELKFQLSYLDIPMYELVRTKAGATYNGGAGTRLNRKSDELATSVQLSTPASNHHLLVAGASFNKRTISTTEYNISDWRIVNLTGAINHSTGGEDRNYAVFVQDDIYLTDKLTTNIGARYDIVGTSGVVDSRTYDNREKSHLSPKASLVYRPSETTTVRSSIGNAFHVPNLRDTFGWWSPTANKPDGITPKDFVPNPDLKPETVTSWEIGVEHKYSTGTLARATFYTSKLKNLIYRSSDSTSETVGNAGAGSVKGIELELRHPVTSGLSVYANATFNRSLITQNAAIPASVGKKMTNTPSKMLNAGLQVSEGPWNGSINAHYVGKVYTHAENLDKINNVNGSYDPFTLVDAKLSYKVKKNISASLSIDNLLDRQYYQSTRAQGRAYFGELSLQF